MEDSLPEQTFDENIDSILVYFLLNTASGESLPIEPVGISPWIIGNKINLSSSGVYWKYSDSRSSSISSGLSLNSVSATKGFVFTHSLYGFFSASFSITSCSSITHHF